jgi:hypothetical protein
MKPQEKLKTALDETRLLMLGAQIVFGFHLNGVFQDAFDKLSPTAKLVHAVAFVFMVLTMGLLIAPSMQHRLIERGEATDSIKPPRYSPRGRCFLSVRASHSIFGS